MSRKGVLFSFIILAFLGAAININAGWLYFFVSALMGFTIVAFIYHYIYLRLLHIRLITGKSHIDTATGLYFTLYSDKYIAPYKLIIHINNKKHVVSPDIDEAGGVKYRVELSTRGKYHVDNAKIELYDTTGVILLKKNLDISEDIYVYPQVAESDIVVYPVVYQGMIREGKLSSTNTGVLFSYIRDYHKGDNIRSINWRDYAKTGNLTTKLMESESGSQTLVVNVGAVEEENIVKGLSLLQGIITRNNIQKVVCIDENNETGFNYPTPEWYEYLATVKPVKSYNALADIYIEDDREVIRLL